MEPNGNGQVVVGVCATHAGFQAIRYAVTEARRRGQPLVAVRAYRPANPEIGSPFRHALAESVAEELTRALVEALGAVPTDIPVRGLIRAGSPGRVLAAVADRPADLIVIGGSGARRWTGRRRAGTARQCSRLAVCPVVIVPPPVLARSGSERRLAQYAADTATAFLAAGRGVAAG
jgi:nucleotide-binding universal stress UspA family protein